MKSTAQSQFRAGVGPLGALHHPPGSRRRCRRDQTGVEVLVHRTSISGWTDISRCYGSSVRRKIDTLGRRAGLMYRRSSPSSLLIKRLPCVWLVSKSPRTQDYPTTVRLPSRPARSALRACAQACRLRRARWTGERQQQRAACRPRRWEETGTPGPRVRIRNGSCVSMACSPACGSSSTTTADNPAATARASASTGTGPSGVANASTLGIAIPRSGVK